ncbi:MAG: tetratricopeptide repeat protein [Desulfobacterales bacterium]
MTSNRQTVFHIRRSTREFLVSKTDSPAKKGQIDKTERIDRDRIKKEFPNLDLDRSFTDHALTALNSSRKFGAMGIQIDNFKAKSESDDEDDRTDVWIDVAKSIDKICREENGIWGLLTGDLFGSVFSAKNDLFCRKTAKKIQAGLSSLQNRTVSIGISTYPMLNFDKSQTIANTQKALDHAAFFNGNSIVSLDAVSFNISGDKLYQAKDFHGALKEFTIGLMIDPSNVNLHNSLGVCHGVLGSLDKALESFDAALWLDPDEMMALYNKGLIFMMQENREKALDLFLQANRSGEDVFEILFQIGRIYLQMGKSKEGRTFLEKAVKLKPDSGSAFRFLGECCAVDNMIEEAINAYTKAVKQNPSDASSLSALGHFFDIQGENAEIAVSLCEQSVRLSPENGLFRHRLGERYLKLNMVDKALEQFQKAVDLGHDSSAFIEKINNRDAEDRLK